MSRQLEQLTEERETKRRDSVIAALEFELAGAVEFIGGEMRGFSIKYDNFEALLTYKATFQGIQKVAFVGSDTPMNCIIKAANMAKHKRLKWKDDRYQAPIT